MHPLGIQLWGDSIMAKCLDCGNTANFNVWCSVSKVLEVELDTQERLTNVIGEPEDETLQDEEEYWVLGDDLEFSLVSCAWCGSKKILVEKTLPPVIKKKT